jgi:hypothetical protein
MVVCGRRAARTGGGVGIICRRLDFGPPAVERVEQDLRSQAIVWIEGRYLSREITLVDKGDGITIAR